jgi:hypothetical protein
MWKIHQTRRHTRRRLLFCASLSTPHLSSSTPSVVDRRDVALFRRIEQQQDRPCSEQPSKRVIGCSTIGHFIRFVYHLRASLTASDGCEREGKTGGLRWLSKSNSDCARYLRRVGSVGATFVFHRPTNPSWKRSGGNHVAESPLTKSNAKK